jgi:hypothetical protein
MKKAVDEVVADDTLDAIGAAADAPDAAGARRHRPRRAARAGSPAAVRRTQVMFDDEPSHLTALPATGLLIETEMNPSVDPRVVDVGGQVAKRLVVQRHPGNRGVRQRERPIVIED